jgi:hypothetical protein
MLPLNQIRLFSDDPYRYPMSADDIDNAKIAIVIIVAVFTLQLTFAGLALLFMAR